MPTFTIQYFYGAEGSHPALTTTITSPDFHRAAEIARRDMAEFEGANRLARFWTLLGTAFGTIAIVL
jgi:hypothetical protein